MLKLILLAAVVVAPAARSSADPVNSYVLSLNSDNDYGGGWSVESSNGTIAANVTVPGGIYSDLMKVGIIGDVLFKDNDVQTRWVSKTEWIYKRTFSVTSETLAKNTIRVVFDGLDTISSIAVNDNPVGTTDNMFFRYKFDIKPYLQEGDNVIAVTFASPVLTAAALSAVEMVPPECIPDLFNGECHVNQLRKMQASFAWDWGPAFPSVGIWKPVYIEAYNSVIIKDSTTLMYFYDHEGEEDEKSIWYLWITAYLDVSAVEDDVKGDFEYTIELENEVKLRGHKYINESAKGKAVIEAGLSARMYDEDVVRWWPNGYGEQILYDITVAFKSEKFTEEYFYKKYRIGFRTMELVEDDFGDGKTFYFKVNYVPIFMKGSNWIPSNILPEQSYDKKTVDFLLQSAVDANMNMLRVWGGGLYESDYFYEKCDELGILIWQDMMFACSMYPVNQAFISSVSQEAQLVSKRIQHHPSIALWAGNNENEAALRDNWYDTVDNFDQYKEEYIKLYVDTLEDLLEYFDDPRIYVVSSPSNGQQSKKEGYIAENPYDPNYGDTHYYNYAGDLWSMETYPKTRFASEYGFQSLPSMDTLATATNDPNDLKIDSAFMAHRQHSPSNNYENMEMHITNQFGALDKNDVNYPTTFQYYTQIMQAWAMKTETEFYRQSRDDWMTMGALYWQLNDVWQAPTWSGIDFAGNWKMLHFYAKDFFSPVLISPRMLTNDIAIRIINDKVDSIENAKMTVDTFFWDSFTVAATQTTDVNIPPLSAERYGTNIAMPPAAARSLLFYRFSLRDADSNLISPYNYIFPAAMRSIQGYTAPTVSFVIVNPNAPGPVYDVDVTSTGIGLFVWLQVDQSFGRLSDNGFIMTERTKRIQLRINTKMNLQKFNEIKVKVFDKEHFA